jgi:hypothetical protein
VGVHIFENIEADPSWASACDDSRRVVHASSIRYAVFAGMGQALMVEGDKRLRIDNINVT